MNRSMADHVLAVLGDHEREGVAGGLRPAGAADAVDVVLRVLRHVVVDDVADVRDVEAARGDVRGHEHLEAAVAEAAQGLLAFALGAVGVQHGHGVVVALEQCCATRSAPCLVRQKTITES